MAEVKEPIAPSEQSSMESMASLASIAGILNVFKPPGITSRAAVDVIQAMVKSPQVKGSDTKTAKVGHAGTLDPIAEGVLLMAVGWAVRLVPYLQQQVKYYRGEFLLGVHSESLDCETDIVTLDNAPIPSLEDLTHAMSRWIGTRQQTPPVYSALKVRGKRSCDRVRKGERVVLASRPVDIYAIRCVAFNYPRLILDVECGQGTYIRSLGDDIARELGTRAVMTDLCRTGIGAFKAEEALTLEGLTPEQLLANLHAPRSALAHLPTIHCSEDELSDIAKGRFLKRTIGGREAACLDDQDRLRAIMVQRTELKIGPRRVFPVEGVRSKE